jgi:trimethylamine--corrinoid protein Co-methyltransferase
LIYGMGMLELGVTFSYAQLLIDDEIATMVKRVVQGITVNDETLAVDVIKRVGPGKDFLGQRHTRDFMDKEQSKPKLIDRHMRGAWNTRGSKSMAERANEMAIELLASHKPSPLPEDVLKRFKEIIQQAEHGSR